jgi:hypothetical protein
MQMSDLALKSIESLFRSEQFLVIFMSFIRSHLPGGENRRHRIASVIQALRLGRFVRAFRNDIISGIWLNYIFMLRSHEI